MTHWHFASNFKSEGGFYLDYVIKNHKDVYIRLTENGKPDTCKENKKGVFDRAKALNILRSLPKGLKNLNFRVECIPDIPPKIIENTTYEISDNINRWVGKFGQCYDTVKEAKDRVLELTYILENIDNEFLNILHSIELEKSKDMYGGWREYKNIKENREKRRIAKDELLILNDVLKDIKLSVFERERIRKSIDGLLKRKYTYRVVEEENQNDNVQDL